MPVQVERATIVLAATVLVVGCDAEGKDWDAARTANTVESYEQFLIDYPEGQLADSAHRRIEDLVWDSLVTSGSREDFMAFEEQFPRSPRLVEAQAHARWFAVASGGSGSMGLPPDDRVVRTGPIVAIRPQWDSLSVVLARSTVFAVGAGDERVHLRYVVPIDLAGNSGAVEVVSPPSGGRYVSRETWFTQTNSFTDRYRAFGTADGVLGFGLEFGEDRAGVRVGLVFERDLSELIEIHVLGTVLDGTAEPATN